MSENESDLIGIIETLCDAVSDMPCGCDCCPYADTIVDCQCEVYDVISKVKKVMESNPDSETRWSK